MSTTSEDTLYKAVKKIAYLREDIRRLSVELKKKEALVFSISDELRRKDILLSNCTDLAVGQSRLLSTLSAAIQDTVLLDPAFLQPTTSSTPDQLWTKVASRG